MAKRSKRHQQIAEKIEKGRLYTLDEGLDLVKETGTAKFEESVELHVRLGVDPRHADQQVRSTVVLPSGTGITKKVLVIADGDKLKEAEEAGADFVGGEDMVQKIQGGWLEFDAVIATPDMMRVVGRLGKILGPRGMMPSAKTNTVTFDIADAVREIKAGRVEFRVDKFGIIHNSIGKVRFEKQAIFENIKALLGAIVKARPAAVKGTYVKSVTLSTSMGVGIHLDPLSAQKEIAE